MSKYFRSFNRKHFTLIIIFLLPAIAYGQKDQFKATADKLQLSTHNSFYSSVYKCYNATNTGNTSFNYWWNAHGVDAILDGYIRTRDYTLKLRMKNLLLGIKSRNGGMYPTTFYDDMAWLALSSLRAYETTADVEYLSACNALWTDMKTGQHAAQGGAIQWNKSAPYSFNACTNGPAIILATRLYRVKGLAADLETAISIYTWMKSALVNPTTGEVWDSYNSDTKYTNKGWIFSYNQGTWIGACLELYKTTGEMSYLNEAVKTANSAIKNNIGGILYPNSGGGDGGLFHGIFVRYLNQLAHEANLPLATRQNYFRILKSSALALQNQGINTENFTVSPKWGVAPGAETDFSSQLSGVMLIEAATTFDQCGIFSKSKFDGLRFRLSDGEYKLADLMLKGIVDNSIGSVTLPPWKKIILYADDQFGGDSLICDTSVVDLKDWKSKTSSLKIISVEKPFERKINSVDVVTIYTDCDYKGYYQGFQVNEFRTEDLLEKGILDNEIAAVKVLQGFQVILFENDDFTGDSIIITSDSVCLNNWKNKASSMKVKTNGIKNLEGKYFIKNKLTSYYLTIEGSTTNTADGANIIQNRLTKYTNQQFQFLHMKDGAYKITAMHSSKPVEVSDFGKTDGYNIQQMAWLGTDNQQFVLVPSGTDTYKLVAKHSGKIAEAQTLFLNGNIRQWTNTNQTKGQWIFEAVPFNTANDEIPQSNQIRIYPNPVTDGKVYVQVNDLTGCEVIISDLTGKRVNTSNLEKSDYIDLKNVHAGIYQIHIRNNYFSHAEKIIIL